MTVERVETSMTLETINSDSYIETLVINKTSDRGETSESGNSGD